jgi:uncharacterized protein (DUF3820 family)
MIIKSRSIDQLLSDPQLLLKLASYKMPFGKYKGCLLVDLPEPYVIWFSNKGFPHGELGHLLAITLEIKVNGLEYLFQPLNDPNFVFKTE